ncbi:hypothetical protein G9P44_005324 [Scheffersomyces stipitis]|nr:hypothetical protein G9P44_005324 [Scheffersomyces stipitis]
MIDPEAFKKFSPFKGSHSDSSCNYNLANTTSDLLKFQLQEQYRQKLSELTSANDSNTTALKAQDLHLLNTAVLQDSFNSHLQSTLDDGVVSIQNDSSYSSLSSGTPVTSEDEESFEIESFIDNKANTPNYLNLKVLIENSIFDTSKINKDAVLSLSSLKRLKRAIASNREKQHYLLDKITLSQQFIADVVVEDLNSPANNVNNVDAKLIVKILKSTGSLQNQLIAVNSHLDMLNSKLNNHNMACLVLGYVEDVKLSSGGKQIYTEDGNITTASSPAASPMRHTNSTSNSNNKQDSLLKSFDSMLSHIVSIAAQRNISLPNPPLSSEDMDLRTKWAQDCIDKILNNNQTEVDESMASQGGYLSNYNNTNNNNTTNNYTNNISNGPTPLSSPTKYQSYLNDTSFYSNASASPAKGSNDKMIQEYKTALNDLRFSYQYLNKEYELSRDSSQKLIQEYRKKISQLEKDHAKIPSSVSSSDLNSNHDTLSSKDKEIAKLRKELSAMKVEQLGMKNNNASSYSLLNASPRLSSEGVNLHTSVSPITGESLHVPHDSINIDDDDENLLSARPISGIPSNSTSNAILRKEFKKIVNDIQDQYEVELGEERYKRRLLQEELVQLKKQ